jgi:hypothetical protein
MTIKIDKGIPAPQSTGHHGSELTSVLAAMDVGDSILLAKVRASVSSSVIGWGYRQNPRRKFAQRKQPDGSTRIWRIA